MRDEKRGEGRVQSLNFAVTGPGRSPFGRVHDELAAEEFDGGRDGRPGGLT